MTGRRAATAFGLLAPFALAVPQWWFVPRWYEAASYVAGGLLVVHLATCAYLIVRALRHRAWRIPRRLAAVLGLLLLAAAALEVTFSVNTREGLFVCGRELAAEVPCPGGGTAYEFDAVCIAGNPHVEVEIRPNRLPFMYRTDEPSGGHACRALRPR